MHMIWGDGANIEVRRTEIGAQAVGLQVVTCLVALQGQQHTNVFERMAHDHNGAQMAMTGF